jgi:TRAP transporter TAXI family solute receptor
MSGLGGARAAIPRRGVLAVVAGTAMAGLGWVAFRRPTATDAAADVRIATGGTKGVYYAYGALLANELRARPSVLTAKVDATTGSIDNLRRLASGAATLAFTAGDAAAQAYQGQAPFEGPVALAAIARVYDDYVHLVVPRASPVAEPADLVGRTVSLGPVGSGTALIAERVLAVAGVRTRSLTTLRLGINESITALAGGRADAFFWSGGLPTGGVSELAQGMPIRLVPLGDLAEPMRVRHGAVYRAATVPSGVYGSAERLTTIAVPNLLVCRPDADRTVVRDVAEALFGSRRAALAAAVPQAETLDERSAIATFPLPLHPGAQGYYRAFKP